MIPLIQSLILGVVEGITEFLPISSTAHLVLTSELLKIPQTNFQKSFEIIIQLGAIFAVVFLYWRKLLTDMGTVKRVAIAFLPTGVLGLIFYKVVKTYLLGNVLVIVWALLIGGVLLIAFEIWNSKKGIISLKEEMAEPHSITYKQALTIGLFQAIAMVPGVSRSASTIIGGLLLGINRKTIVEFSFLLAVPTMLAATGLDLVKNYGEFQGQNLSFLIVGFISAFIMALISVKFLLRYVENHDFKAFGIYRIGIGLLFLLFFI